MHTCLLRYLRDLQVPSSTSPCAHGSSLCQTGPASKSCLQGPSRSSIPKNPHPTRTRPRLCRPGVFAHGAALRCCAPSQIIMRLGQVARQLSCACHPAPATCRPVPTLPLRSIPHLPIAPRTCAAGAPALCTPAHTYAHCSACATTVGVYLQHGQPVVYVMYGKKLLEGNIHIDLKVS